MILKNCNFIIFLILTLGFISCSSSINSKDEADFNWNVKKSRLNLIRKQSLKLNKIKLEKINYSFDGNWFCGDSTIFLFDNLFKTVTEFSLRGSVIKQLGGIDTIGNSSNWWLPYTLTKNDSGYTSVFLRSIAYLDDSFNVKRVRDIKFQGRSRMLSMLDVPDPFNMNVYELNERNSNYLPISKNELLVSLESEAPAFNPYNSSEYYRKALSFGLINVKKGTLIGVPIRKSNVYNQVCCLSVQDGSYIIKKEELYHVQFAADTLIYVYDINFKPLFAYGLKGKFIQNFVNNMGLEIAFEQEKYLTLQNKANTIDGIFLIEEKYIGRLIYNRTEKKKYIQLYQNFDLVSEFEVPDTFQWIGVIKNQIIGVTKQDNNEKIEICVIN